jgi:hypothetical protein
MRGESKNFVIKMSSKDEILVNSNEKKKSASQDSRGNVK